MVVRAHTKKQALAIFLLWDIRFPSSLPIPPKRGVDFLRLSDRFPIKTPSTDFLAHSSHGVGNGLAIKTTTSHTNNTHVKRRNACKFDLPASKVYSCLSLELFKKSPTSQAKPPTNRPTRTATNDAVSVPGCPPFGKAQDSSEDFLSRSFRCAKSRYSLR